MAKGYYSLIQFQPDPSRAESANIGVILFCPELEYIDVKLSRGNDRVRRFFDQDGNFDKHHLNEAKHAIENRIGYYKENSLSYGELDEFVKTRSNEIKLTAPRPVKVTEPTIDIEDMFNELVGGRARKKKTKRVQPLFERIDKALREPDIEPKIKFRYNIPVRGLEYKIFADYSYINGHLTAIKKHSFPPDGKKAFDDAKDFAIDNDLLRRHGTENVEGAELVVIGAFDNSQSANTYDIVMPLLDEYKVQLVTSESIDELISTIKQEARPFPLLER